MTGEILNIKFLFRQALSTFAFDDYAFPASITWSEE